MHRVNMTPMSIIVAVDHNGGFAKDGKIPWHYPEDLKHFKQTTNNNPCVMGRNTYEELVEYHNERQKKNEQKGKQIVPIDQIDSILPNRDCYVVTNSLTQTPGATPVGSLTKAVNSLDKDDNREIFVLGGYRLFVEALSWVEKVYMTVIEKSYNCDRYFPVKFVHDNFKIVDGHKTKRVKFVTYQRKGN